MKFEEILNKAKDYNKRGTNWHFHMLSPECMFNKRKDKFCIRLEDTDKHATYEAVFDSKPLAEAERLASLQYKESFLVDGKTSENKEFKKILARAKSLCTDAIDWHHHHIFPDCEFNKYPGKHCIVFEDPIKKTVIWAVYENDYHADLMELERLFYKK